MLSQHCEEEDVLVWESVHCQPQPPGGVLQPRQQAETQADWVPQRAHTRVSDFSNNKKEICIQLLNFCLELLKWKEMKTIPSLPLLMAWHSYSICKLLVASLVNYFNVSLLPQLPPSKIPHGQPWSHSDTTSSAPMDKWQSKPCWYVTYMCVWL